VAFETGEIQSAPATATYTINAAGKTANGPTAIISSPGDGAEAMGQVPIVGPAAGPAFGYWQLDYQMIGGSNWTTFAQGANQVNCGTK
jgi:hypothetical protein